MLIAHINKGRKILTIMLFLDLIKVIFTKEAVHE